MIPYQIIRSAKRKTIALQLKSGELVVRAPFGVTQQYIERLVSSKQAWIASKLHCYLQREKITADHATKLEDGGRIWLYGHKRTIQLQFTASTPVQVLDNQVVISLHPRYQKLSKQQHNQQIKLQLARWMKHHATMLIEAKLAHFSPILQLTPTKVSIRLYKARWGSCNSLGQLSFNYLLMMLPESVVDYLVIHELCHLQFLDHSGNFWQLVSDYCPNYQDEKQWLKQHQSCLAWPETTN